MLIHSSQNLGSWKIDWQLQWHMYNKFCMRKFLQVASKHENLHPMKILHYPVYSTATRGRKKGLGGRKVLTAMYVAHCYCTVAQGHFLIFIVSHCFCIRCITFQCCHKSTYNNVRLPPQPSRLQSC